MNSDYNDVNLLFYMTNLIILTIYNTFNYGILVDHPVPIPSDPLTRIIGMIGT